MGAYAATVVQRSQDVPLAPDLPVSYQRPQHPGEGWLKTWAQQPRAQHAKRRPRGGKAHGIWGKLPAWHPGYDMNLAGEDSFLLPVQPQQTILSVSPYSTVVTIPGLQSR